MIEVIKRDGTTQHYDKNKIINAITKACIEVYPEDTKKLKQLTKKAEAIAQRIEELNLNNVEGIQDFIEEHLMYIKEFKVAKAFILYREKRKNIRETMNKKLQFIENYKSSDNTANATIDDNSNVANKNVAVLNSELHKKDNAEINLRLWENKLKELYPNFNYKQLRKDADTICYLHDLSSQVGMPYCVAISMYPFLLNGIKDLGGLSAKPKNLDSFCGMFVNMVFALSSQYKGAIATPGVLLCMDYFIRKEYSDDYINNLDKNINNEYSTIQRTLVQQIHQYFQQICYSLMQPAGGRGNQSVFWNLSVFDKSFYETMYGDFYFPDGTQPKWETFNWLQKEFLHWLNQERLKCILTFPVVSVALIYQDNHFLDAEMADFVAKEYSEGNSFFTYISDSADSLSSCCRLSSKIDKPQFNFTNGQLSEMTGSKNVITLNINRIIQDWAESTKKDNLYIDMKAQLTAGCPSLKKYLITILDRIYKYHIAYNSILMDLYNAGLLPAYNAGFIDMKKQYLTIGINGLNQAWEFLGYTCNNNQDYADFCNMIFGTIKEQNTLHKTKDLMFNTEFTPCESAAIKLYNRDKKDGYWTPEDTNLYASYIYKPNDPNISVLEKIAMHGAKFCGDYLDGGSSAHINLDTHLDKCQYTKLLDYAAKMGCKYFTFNVPNSECDNCGYITKVPITQCPNCNSKDISYYDRVIGYLTKIKNWSKGRQDEHKTRVFKSTDYGKETLPTSEQ